MSSVLFRPLHELSSRRSLKVRRKIENKELRGLVKFAERYDPVRKLRISFKETLKKLGWPHRPDDTITEGVTVLASMSDKYVAFEMAPSGAYTFAGPQATPLDVKPKLILAPDLQKKNDILIARGWKVVWIPQDAWLTALASKRQHDCRFNLLLDLTLAQEPFTPRILA